MAKSRITPELKARRAQLGQLMEGAGIKSMEDIQELFKDMIATFVNQGLEGELDEELGYSKYDFRNKDTDNSRNGHSEKTLKTSYGDVDIQVPRDRKGEFEPELVKKQQTTLTGDIEEKILSMYAKGMTTGDIEGHIKEIYGLDVSDSTISRITDKILPVVKEWQARPLQELYAVVYMDAIHFHVRAEGQIVKKAVYIVSHIFQYLRYLLCILRSKAFIRVKKGDPVSFCLVNGKIFGSSKIIDPWEEKYLCPHFPGNLHRTVTASCIYYDLFTHNILPPGKGAADIFFFIFHNHTL